MRRCWCRRAPTRELRHKRGKHGNSSIGSRVHREEPDLDDRAGHPGGQRGRLGGDRAAVLPALDNGPGRGPQAVSRAAAHRPRHLYPRGLLQLPQPDDTAVPRRDRTLRALLGGRGVHLRPSFPVGEQAHRPGPGARGWTLQRRVAPLAPEPAPRRSPGIQHACVSVVGADAGGRDHDRGQDAGSTGGRRALHR